MNIWWIVILVLVVTLALVGTIVVWIISMIVDDEEWFHDEAERRDGLRNNE